MASSTSCRRITSVRPSSQAVPSLFVAGSADPVLLMTPPAVAEGWLSDHRGDVLVEGAGHWVQQERPAEVNAALGDFVAVVREGR